MNPGLEFYPRDDERKAVKTLAAFGHSHQGISEYLKIDKKTLTKHFKHELQVGKIDLSHKCGGFLLETVMNEEAKTKDRIRAAEFILSRMCGWNEKAFQDSSIDAMAVAIRDGVIAVSSALQDERKDAPKNDKDVNVERNTQ